MGINASASEVEAPARAHRDHARYARTGAPATVETAARVDGSMDESRSGVILQAPWAQSVPRAEEGGREPPIGGPLKRLFDICFAGSALLVLAPLLLLTAIAVRIDTGRSAIFKQERGGFGLKPFRIWKFRTMRVSEDGAQVVQAKFNDPRVTKLGGFLRQTSWDELPQLVNILIGDMSLIGPRPHALEHDRQFAEIDPTYPERGRARPGITGLAQVSGCRGPTETPQKVIDRTAWDVKYVREWSFKGDLKIIVKTVKLLLKWKDDENAF